MVDIGDLKSPDLNSRAGSSPAPGTNIACFELSNNVHFCSTNPLLAQLVEQVALNDKVVGSNPTGGTR